MKRNFYFYVFTLFVLLKSLQSKAKPVPLTFDKNLVQFIFRQTGPTNFEPDGTSFVVNIMGPLHALAVKRFLGIPIMKHPDFRIRFLYFVTAKHVLYDENSHLRTNLVFRLNSAKGGVQFNSITDVGVRVIQHPDPAVDAAVIAFDKNVIVRGTQVNKTNLNALLQPSIRMAFVSEDQLKNEQKMRNLSLREGDDMFFVGLFTQFQGISENYSIYRFGRLSTLTDDKIPFVTENPSVIMPQKLYLMETQAFGGNSGSPAFFVLHDIWGTHVVLAGVVKGYFIDVEPVKFLTPVGPVQLAPNEPIPASSGNTGMAAIVPAYQIDEIINSKEEIAFRQEVDTEAFGEKANKFLLLLHDALTFPLPMTLSQ